GHTGTAQLTEFGGAGTVTLQLSPSTITANGSATSTATATVKDANGNGVTNEVVTFTTDGDVTFGTITNNNNGTYDTTITASNTADVEHITAQDAAAGKSGNADLTETAGAANKVTLTLNPTHIPANGTSTSTATATVQDGSGNPVTIDTVNFTSS